MPAPKEWGECSVQHLSCHSSRWQKVVDSPSKNRTPPAPPAPPLLPCLLNCRETPENILAPFHGCRTLWSSLTFGETVSRLQIPGMTFRIVKHWLLFCFFFTLCCNQISVGLVVKYKWTYPQYIPPQLL